jgi:hypothetical protein
VIESLKDLERFFKLCRKQGITKADLSAMAFEFGDLPQEQGQAQAGDDLNDPYRNFPTGELTPEQLMFYSAGGVPEDDPVLKGNA